MFETDRQKDKIAGCGIPPMKCSSFFPLALSSVWLNEGGWGGGERKENASLHTLVEDVKGFGGRTAVMLGPH